tara:strand:+ start:1199 stop:1639 length:441 start_codon:yes stop_codon:yes gene_type:complete
MRKIYHNFTNEEEVLGSLILETKKGKHIKIKDTQNKFVKNVITKLSEDFKFKIKDESYWLIEHRPRGHKWHKDTGSKNHMMWCEVGVSLMLKKANNGGETYYSDNGNINNPIKIERDLYDLVAHTSDEWHMVEKHQGERIVFLMFI